MCVPYVLVTRTEKDALNLCLQGPTGCTKNFQVMGIFKVQTSCSQLDRNGSGELFVHLLFQNQQLPYSLLLTRTQSFSHTSWGTGTHDYAGYFNISAQTQLYQHTPNIKISNNACQCFIYCHNCETFQSSSSKKFQIKPCKETED